MARGFRPGTEIAYMMEHGISKKDLLALPSQLPGIPGGVLVRLRDNGVIKKPIKNKGRAYGAEWEPGINFQRIIEHWDLLTL